MCGLVGIYSSNMTTKHKDALSALLYLDTWRGRDSTGVAAIRANADTHILKATVPGYEFVEGPRLEQHLRLNDFCWIGHNRYGTVGRNIKSNAHPFDILDEDGSCLVVGAHNGTLKNKHILQDHLKFGTDSEALFNQIAKTSLEDTIPLIEGAWALTYYDHVAEELKILRNSERTLFYAFEEGRKTLIWASESWMIRVVCSRIGIKLDEDQIRSFAEDTLYTFPVPLKLNDEIIMERKEGVVGKQAPAFFQGYTRQGGDGWKKGTQNSSSQQERTTNPQSPTAGRQVPVIQPSNLPSGTKQPEGGAKHRFLNATSLNNRSNKSEKVVPISRTYKGFKGEVLTKTELENDLSGGCSFCEITFINMYDRFGWLDKGKPVCSKCLDGSHMNPVEAAKSAIN